MAAAFFSSLVPCDKAQCNVQRPDRRQWFALPRQKFIDYALTAHLSGGLSPFALDEVFGGGGGEGKRLRLVVDIDAAEGDPQALIASWCNAVTRSQRTAISETRRPRFHSLWYNASRAGKLSLHGIWPMLALDSASDMHDLVCYLRDKHGASPSADVEIYHHGQLRLPLSPKADGLHPLRYEGEYDLYGAVVLDPQQRHGTTTKYRPPWRADGRTPDLQRLFAYSTVVNYCADQQPELLGGRGYDLANDFAVYQRALHPRNEDEHPSFDYFSADNPLRRARLDMRNDRVHWDPLRDVAKVAALVHRDPVEPYSKAVEFMNQRFALLIGPPTRQLLVKSRVMGRDLTGYNITLERVSDPAKFFAETCDYKMLNMPSDARNQQLFPANPDAKNPKAWNWFDWYLEHRLGVQRVTSVVFRPLEKGEESPDDVLNIWQGLLCHDFTVRDAGEVATLASPLSRPNKLRTILEHVEHVFCRGDRRLAHEFHHSIAHTLRKPSVKLPRASIVNGIEGTGKSAFFIEFLGKRLMGQGRHWMVTFNVDDVIGQWSGLLETQLYVFIEESDFNASNRQGTAKLQQAITGDTRVFNEKYERNRTGYTYFTLVLMTNYEQPVSPNITNRRFVFFPCLDVRHWDRAQRDAYFRQLTEALFSDEGAQLYWSYLLTLDIDAWRDSVHQNVEQTYYTMEQMISAMAFRPESSALHWMFSKIKMRDFGLGRLLKRDASGTCKFTEVKDDERFGRQKDQPVMWGSDARYVVEVVINEAFENYHRECGTRQKANLERFCSQIERVFHPQVLAGERVNEGPRWRFGTLQEAEAQFATVLPNTSGFTFQGYRDYLHQEIEELRVQQQKRLVMNPVHAAASKRQKPSGADDSREIIVREATLGGSSGEDDKPAQPFEMSHCVQTALPGMLAVGNSWD